MSCCDFLANAAGYEKSGFVVVRSADLRNVRGANNDIEVKPHGFVTAGVSSAALPRRRSR